MVFQDYALYPTMTVRGNLAFPLQMRKLAPAEIRRRIAWVADLLALGDVLDRLPKHLSGGQRQRVAMGRALVREPTVFLLDEPLSNLDAQLRTQVRGEIVDLQRRTGTTMIYVTHDQVEAMTMGQRIAVLSAGCLQQAGSPQALYQSPANTFVAGFIGTPPMNLIPAGLLKRVAEFTGSSHDLNKSSYPASSAAETCRTLGIRPEHIAVIPEAGVPGLPAQIVQSEYLGHETLVHFMFRESGRQDTMPVYTARMEGSPRFEAGQAVRIRLDPERLVGFDSNDHRCST
jgi:ABC-type sugar transport system ATPase subunit